jgi:hypothetical protein
MRLPLGAVKVELQILQLELQLQIGHRSPWSHLVSSDSLIW